MTPPNVITQAFANAGNYTLPPATSSIIVANQPTGFPPIQATPYSLGGLPVDIGQMNGVFNLYSGILAWFQAGGTPTFNQDISTAIGGYPQYSVLSYVRANGSVGFVYSNINNNNDDFVTTPSFIGVTWIDVSQGFYPSITNPDLQHFTITTNTIGHVGTGCFNSTPDVNNNLTNSLYLQDATGNQITFLQNINVPGNTVAGDIALYNTSDEATQIQMNFNGSGQPELAITTYSSVSTPTISTGIELAYGTRPGLLGTPTINGTSFTIFDDFQNSLTTNGWQNIAGGLIIQWQFQTIVPGLPVTISFPKPFPNACFSIATSTDWVDVIPSPEFEAAVVCCRIVNNSTFQARTIPLNSSEAFPCTFISIGY